MKFRGSLAEYSITLSHYYRRVSCPSKGKLKSCFNSLFVSSLKLVKSTQDRPMESTYDIDRFRGMLNRATHSRYSADTVLGAGSFGVVIRALDKESGQPVAIKFVQPRKMHDYLESEVCNHRALRHPHVIRFKQALAVEGLLAIVMEYANGSNLRQKVKTDRRLPEPLARWIFQQLILAVDYCHRKGIASRDIKCDNILLIQGQRLPIVKLSDFGYSVHRSTTPST